MPQGDTEVFSIESSLREKNGQSRKGVAVDSLSVIK